MKAKTIITSTIIALMLSAFFSNAIAQFEKVNDHSIKLKSEKDALTSSLLGTLVPVAAGAIIFPGVIEYDVKIPVLLITTGLIIGPSFGYFHGGCDKRGLRGILIRAGTGTLIFVTSWAYITSKQDEWSTFAGLEAGMKVCAVGAGVILVEAIYDIAAVKSTVRKHNEEMRQKNQTSVTLLPKYFADSRASGA